MKLNKLLAPLLGLSAVATVVAPVATSCASETKSTNHTSRPDCYTKELTEHGDLKYAEYLINLDSDEYDKNSFSVSLSFTEGHEIYGFDINDFEERHELDGSHLHVYVGYTGSKELEELKTLHLNLNVKYGSQWNETVEVLLEIDGYTTYDLDYDGGRYYVIEGFSITTGQSIQFNADLSKASSTFWEETEMIACLQTSPWTFISCDIKGIKVYLDGEQLAVDTDYKFEEGSSKAYIHFTSEGYAKLKTASTLSIRFIKITNEIDNAQMYFGFEGA